MNNLKTLKKGLDALKSISEEDENWLDGPANLIDKQRVIEALTSDYNQGLQGLDEDSWLLVEKLRELGGGGSKIVRKKKSSKLKCSPGRNSNPTKPAPVSQFNTGKKQRATLAIQIEVLNHMRDTKMKQKQTAAYFCAIYPDISFSQPLLSDWLKDEAKWQAEWDKSSVANCNAKQVQQTEHPEPNDQGITPSSIYEINQLQAMQLANAAWWKVDTSTLRNCWKKAGILPNFTSSVPSQPSVPVSFSSLLHRDTDIFVHAEKAVEEALDALQATGALQKVNQMGLREILNPKEEHGTASSTLDVEIVKTVMAESRSADTSAGAGGSWDNKEDGPVESPPMHKEVLVL
ncbi:hypothetical protein SERLA73DRAFT_80233 [Serpula lacrymans var. lacrymans S7.3]|uniref:Uncharacterized protein n=1 Tax=Serpula lacrymans var. lacrymans (strain S7.3) TaxID=936435 RepID=F8QJ58_SERL3|nr:hypothetical protein SERLA73DRAFT_80233 [Serpula lacrymans var. lacrymans S7.3]